MKSNILIVGFLKELNDGVCLRLSKELNMYYANGMWVGSSYTQNSTYYSENSDIGKILMINDSGNAVWAEPPQSGTAVQILTWEATD